MCSESPPTLDGMDDASLDDVASLCLLCSSAPSLPECASPCGESFSQVREHLVKCHSSFVAHAFLHPNPLDHLHMWLMTCVDYQLSPTLPLTVDENEENEVEDEENEGLSEVWKAILASTQTQSDVQQSRDTSRRGQKRRLGAVEEGEKRERMEDEGESLEGLDEEEKVRGDGLTVDDTRCHLCGDESRYPGRHIAQKHLKKWLYECGECHSFGSYEACTVHKHMRKVHPECDSAPICNLEKFADEIRELQKTCFPNRPMKLVKNLQPSRPRERHHCRLCDVQVAQSDRQRHVYHKHLQKKRVFECPLCTFHSNYDVHRVKWHIKWIHKEDGLNVEPISHEHEYREEIDALNEECFPGWQHRRKGEEKALKEDDDTCSEPRMEKQMSVEESEEVKEEREKSESKLDEEEEEEEVKEVNEWTCTQCLKELKPSSNFLRHVLKCHVNVFLYECPLCSSHGAAEAYEVRAHITKVHKVTDVEPREMQEHNELIARTYALCFPHRKLKKLPTKENGEQSVGGGESEKKGMEEKNTVSSQTKKRTRGDAKKEKEEEMKAAREGKEERAEEDEAPRSPSQLLALITSNKSRDDDRVGCALCGVMLKTEERQMHVYRHHLREPRLFECPLCDFAHHASTSDVRAHIKFNHREAPDAQPISNLDELSERIAQCNDECFPGWINRRLSSSAREDFTRCRVCNEAVRQTSRHIAQVHLNVPLHQCPLCDYGAAESRLVSRHIRNNHTKKAAKGAEPIANVVARRAEFSAMHDRCFPGRPKRLCAITIAEESRRAKCRECGAAVAKKKRWTHILHAHNTLPAYKCSECGEWSAWDEEWVALHVRDVHNGDAATLNCTQHIKDDLMKTAKQCFPEWKPISFDI